MQKVRHSEVQTNIHAYGDGQSDESIDKQTVRKRDKQLNELRDIQDDRQTDNHRDRKVHRWKTNKLTDNCSTDVLTEWHTGDILKVEGQKYMYTNRQRIRQTEIQTYAHIDR